MDAVDEAIDKLLADRRRMQAELEEQARLLGMSAERECDLRGLLIRLYNDLFVHHSGTAVAELKKMFREPNYN
jgi:hypothetical protein